MRICLVSAPTLPAFLDVEALGEDELRRVPLGVLVLAGALEREGHRPGVADLDALYLDHARGRRARTDFAGRAAEELAGRDADIYGLSSICSSYPLTLRIAAALRSLRPGCRIVLGGPQASATAEATLAAFPAVDVVVRGEADGVLPQLVAALGAGVGLSALRGVSYRAGGEVVRAPDAPLPPDLDALPWPAYHLFPAIGERGTAPLEAGRGCPFSCDFCSTSVFFGRRFRMKSPGRILEEMLLLRRAHGVRDFELVHDHLGADRRRLLELCDLLRSTPVRLTWSCSSRADALDGELLERMWSAGCRRIFYGVESGSEAVQRSIGKRLDLAATRAQLARTDRRGMQAAVAFVAALPEETLEDLRRTVDLFVDTLRLDRLEPQLSLLSPLPGTPIHARYRHELVLDDRVANVSAEGDHRDGADLALVARHPQVFPGHYSVPTRHLDLREVDELRRFLLGASGMRWLLWAAARIAGGGLEAFRAFRTWRSGRPGPAPVDPGAYYRGPAFRRDLRRFAGGALAAGAGRAGAALRDLARYFGSVERLPTRPAPRRVGPHPALAADVCAARIGCEAAALLRCVRRGGDLSRVPRRSSTLVTRRRRNGVEVIRVSATAADLLLLCDGRRSARLVLRSFARQHPEVAGVAGEEAGAAGLALLAARRILAPYRLSETSPSRARRARSSARSGRSGSAPAHRSSWRSTSRSASALRPSRSSDRARR
ncbi:MAG TPA: radical SAM protein [Anaeromyxobacter sp.]|nr:radical SAM protein [Anaeromyxobacter sp.]